MKHSTIKLAAILVIAIFCLAGCEAQNPLGPAESPNSKFADNPELLILDPGLGEMDAGILDSIPINPSDSGSDGDSVPGPVIDPDTCVINAGGVLPHEGLPEWCRIGRHRAEVTVVCYIGYEEPFSARWFENTFPELRSEYGGQLNFVFCHAPLPFFLNDFNACVAAEAAAFLGMYEEYMKILYMNNARLRSGELLTNEDYVEFARQAGMSRGKLRLFRRFLSSQKVHQEVQSDFDFWRTKLCNYGVPTFYIGNRRHGFTKVAGAQPTENFAAVIDSYLGCGQKPGTKTISTAAANEQNCTMIR